MKARIILLCIIALIASCSPKIIYRDVPVVEIQHDTVVDKEIITNEKIRTIEVRDSFIQKEKGDTVTIEHWRIERDYSFEAKLQHKIDSLMSLKRDSVTIIQKEFVEKEDGFFKRLFISLGFITFLGLCLFGVIMAVRLYLGNKFIG